MADQYATSDPDSNHQTERLRVALQAAEVGTWDLDIKNQRVWWDEVCKKLYGFEPDDIIPYNQVLSYIHPDDRARVDEAVRLALSPQSEGRYDVHFRTIGAQDGQLRWLHCRGRAYFDAQAQPYRFSGTAQDVTQLLQARQQLLDSEARFADLVTATPAATAVFTGRDMRIQQVNTPMLAIWGKDASVIGKRLHQAMPELEGQPFLAQLQHVFDTGEPFRKAESAAELIENGERKIVWFNHAYNPLYDQTGQIYGVINIAIDVTAQVLARQKVEESELFARMLFDRSPVAKAVFIGSQMVIQMANQNMLSMWGKAPSVIGLPFMEAMPELLPTPQLARLQRVLMTGERFYQAEEKFEILRYGAPYVGFYEYTYEALRSASGVIYGVICAASEVTQQVLARQKVEASEAHLQLLGDTVPAMIFYLDAQQRYQSYNETFRHWFGVTNQEVIGKTVREFVGEVAYQAVQPHLAIAYAGQVEQYELLAPSRMGGTRWLSITYTPHQTPAGEVIGLIVHAADITASKQSEVILREREAALQNAIELAELGTFSVDVATNLLTCSPRVADWFGFDRLTADAETFIQGVGEPDREYVRTSLYNTLVPGSDGRYDVVHSVINAQTGHQIIIHALGRVYFDERGQPLKIEGTAQDITAQRELQCVLEGQVQKRTQELTMANQDLQRSNDNLQQFAYVASHDLQEPLRKIQSFASLISQQLADHSDASIQTYLERIISAGTRMSTLMKDLLNFSRISTRQQAFGTVSLGAILAGVLTLLEWDIQQKGAIIQVDALPDVNGDASQLSQLFQNLLTNALKFVHSGQVPRVHVQYFRRSLSDLPPEVHPTSQVAFYHQISVSDQGIGFDPKFLDRIFQVFQRLHGKNEYPGTGVGLAICQRVVENHGGGITARSAPGEGTTFCVYLPT